MDIIIGGRGSGRTTELIKACAADKGSVIVCPTHHMAKYVAQMAKDMGLDILEPISFDQLQSSRRWLGCRKPKSFYFDNLDLYLRMITDGVPIKSVTIEGDTKDILWLDPSQNP